MNTIMYVDDTDLFLTGKINGHHTSITTKAQQLISKWCSMLWITGGALRPEKCGWYLLSFSWTPDGDWAYNTIKDTPSDLHIPDYLNHPHIIERYEANRGFKGLGIFEAPDGNNNDQLNYMKDKIQNWTNKLSATFISCSAASLALSSTIMATIKYALPSTTYTEKECDALTIPLFKTILPKMGINRHLALVYRYGPASCFGLQCNNIYTEQGIA